MDFQGIIIQYVKHIYSLHMDSSKLRIMHSYLPLAIEEDPCSNLALGDHFK